MFTDLVRVIVVLPIFSYASYRDLKERRVERQVWYPIVFVGFCMMLLDFFLGRSVLIGIFSVILGLVLGYGFYYLGAFGGADKYALVSLGVVFPFYPSILGFPVLDGSLFLVSILGNTILVGVLYPLKLFLENIYNREFSRYMLFARKMGVSDLQNNYGRIIETPDGGFNSGLLSSCGLDLDFIRDYTDWKSIETLKEIDEMNIDLKEFTENTGWTSENLERDEKLVKKLFRKDEVWVSPGIPFIVPLYIGLLSSLIVGDVLLHLVQTVFVF